MGVPKIIYPVGGRVTLKSPGGTVHYPRGNQAVQAAPAVVNLKAPGARLTTPAVVSLVTPQSEPTTDMMSPQAMNIGQQAMNMMPHQAMNMMSHQAMNVVQRRVTSPQGPAVNIEQQGNRIVPFVETPVVAEWRGPFLPPLTPGNRPLPCSREIPGRTFWVTEGAGAEERIRWTPPRTPAELGGAGAGAGAAATPAARTPKDLDDIL